MAKWAKKWYWREMREAERDSGLQHRIVLHGLLNAFVDGDVYIGVDQSASNADATGWSGWSTMPRRTAFAVWESGITPGPAIKAIWRRLRQLAGHVPRVAREELRHVDGKLYPTKPTLRIGMHVAHRIHTALTELRPDRPLRLNVNRDGNYYWSAERAGEIHWWLTSIVYWEAEKEAEKR
jgi:hypothetical protein